MTHQQLDFRKLQITTSYQRLFSTARGQSWRKRRLSHAPTPSPSPPPFPPTISLWIDTSDVTDMPLNESQREIILSHANTLLHKRDYPKTICPSEVARAFSKAELDSLDAPDWRSTMDNVREVVWQLREDGEVEVMQKGEVINAARLEEVRGPIRVRRIQS